MDQSFPPESRLKSPRDFDRVFRESIVVADGVLVIHVTANARGIPRLGLSISKRVGNSPTRNRWKRLIREVFRRQKNAFPPIDLVVRPKKDAIPDFHAIEQSLPRLVERAARKLPRD